MQESDVTLLAQLSTGITTAVQVTGVLQGADQARMSYASEIMRGELYALLRGEGEYGESLRDVADNTVPEDRAIDLLVATCTERIAAFRGWGSFEAYADSRPPVRLSTPVEGSAKGRRKRLPSGLVV